MSVTTNNEIKCNIALSGLYNVYDPEIGLNVVDLGLVYELQFEEDTQKIICTMTLTSEFCPMGESITSDVTHSLQQSFASYQIEVNLIFEPHWNVNMVSDEGREFLGR